MKDVEPIPAWIKEILDDEPADTVVSGFTRKLPEPVPKPSIIKIVKG